MRIALLTLFMVTAAAAVFRGETNGSGETNNSEITYSAKIYNTETFSSVKTVLNPDGVLNNYSSFLAGGLSGEVKYYLDFRWKSDPFSFQASDIGYLDAVTNSAFTNLMTEDYLSFNFWEIFLDAGKKKITQSVCFLTTPIDFAINGFNDISKNKSYNLQFSEGKYMANADWFSDFGVIGLSYMPELDFATNAQQYFSSSQIEQEEFRYTVNISGADMGLALSHDSNWRAGANFSATIGDYVEVHAECAYLEYIPRFGLGTNMTATGFDPASMQPIYSPELTITRENVSNVYQIIVGGTYNGEYFSLYVEYYYNMAGYNYAQWSSIRQSMRDFRSDYYNNSSGVLNAANLGTLMSFMGTNSFLDVCQDYAMIRVTTPSASTEKLGLAWTTLVNLEDLSGMEIFSASYSWDNLSLTGQFTFDFGDDYSEFKLLGQDWTAGVEIEIGI